MEIIDGARTGLVGMTRPLKVHGFTEFGRRMASTCPTPSNRRAQLQPRRH
jgi:hypothetical protein